MGLDLVASYVNALDLRTVFVAVAADGAVKIGATGDDRAALRDLRKRSGADVAIAASWHLTSESAARFLVETVNAELPAGSRRGWRVASAPDAVQLVERVAGELG